MNKSTLLLAFIALVVVAVMLLLRLNTWTTYQTEQLQPAGKRRRQVIMTMAGRLIVWLYRIMPGVVEPIITQVGGVFKDVES